MGLSQFHRIPIRPLRRPKQQPTQRQMRPSCHPLLIPLDLPSPLLMTCCQMHRPHNPPHNPRHTPLKGKPGNLRVKGWARRRGGIPLIKVVGKMYAAKGSC